MCTQISNPNANLIHSRGQRKTKHIKHSKIRLIICELPICPSHGMTESWLYVVATIKCCALY